MNSSFSLALLQGTSRPIVDDLYGGMALIDTGAEIPVCTLPVATLKDLFEAEIRVQNTQITGFGGKDVGDVYSLKEFRFNNLIYPHLPVYVPRKCNFQFRWILSASMFDQLEYSINMKMHILTVTIPGDESPERRLHVYDRNGKLHVLCG